VQPDASAVSPVDKQGAAGSERVADGSSPHEDAVVESEQSVRVRRTPRYGRFMLLGGAVFGVASFIATYSFPQGSGYDRNTVFGLVLLGSVAVGVGLGALAAIVAAAATKHTERTVVADHIDVHPVERPAVSAQLPDLGELPSEAEHGGDVEPGRAETADRAPEHGEPEHRAPEHGEPEHGGPEHRETGHGGAGRTGA
jgi:hypothetical protein